jgi:hypothetical protein
MKKRLLLCTMMLFVVCVPLTAWSARETALEILYMNHGPLRPTLNDIKTLCGKYGGKIQVTWYDFESPEGEKFMAQKGIHQHVPLIIWIDGKSTVKIKDRDVNFTGFPTGSGPAFFQGKWTVNDLGAALDQATRKK